MSIRTSFICIAALGLLLTSGCATSNTSGKNGMRKDSPASRSILVDVYSDGTLQLYGNKISKKELPRKLRKESNVGGKKQRIIELRAKDGRVYRSDLEELRDYLVKNGLPNVSIQTPRRVQVEGGIVY